MTSIFTSSIEPLVIVLLFTFSALINRQRDEPDTVLVYYASGHLSRFPAFEYNRKTRMMQSTKMNIWIDLFTQFIDQFPFLIEILYWNLTYWIYQLLRACSAIIIRGNEKVFNLATTHALQILRVEHILGIDVELSLQKYVLSQWPRLVPWLAYIYYSHICVGVAFIVYAYTFMPAPVFQRIRRTIATNNVIAFVILTLWRCAPPRLLPAEYGFVDVLHRKTSTAGAVMSGSAWTNNRYQLTVAAMPSLHFGTSLLIAVCLCRFSPHRVLRVLAPLWPTAMMVTIVATGNHFLADAVVGAVVPFLGLRWNTMWFWFEPAREMVLWQVFGRIHVESERRPDAGQGHRNATQKIVSDMV